MSPRNRTGIWLLSSTLTLAALVGCMNKTAPSTRTRDFPLCDEVWTTENLIPSDYGGCVVDGTAYEADSLDCEEDDDRLLRHMDRWYGFAGGSAREATTDVLDNDPEYRAMLSECEQGFSNEG